MAEVDSHEIAFRCARHPNTETTLRCGRCETPICPQCLVYTPVGARCPDCGKSGPDPIRQLPPSLLGRAIAAGAGLLLVVALAWGILTVTPLGGFFLLIVAAAIGYGVAAGLNRAARWRRGPVMMAIAAVATLGGFALGLTATYVLAGAPVADAFVFMIQRAISLWTLLALLLSAGIAVSRLR